MQGNMETGLIQKIFVTIVTELNTFHADMAEIIKDSSKKGCCRHGTEEKPEQSCSELGFHFFKPLGHGIVLCKLAPFKHVKY